MLHRRTEVQARFRLGLGSFLSEGGDELPNAHLAYETFGSLNHARDNAVLVLHGLTADSHVTASRADPSPGWWPDVIGAGRVIDTERYYVVVPNALGAVGGSTSPRDVHPDGRAWASRFPVLTVRDQLAAIAVLADRLHIRRWRLVIGASLGGMAALEWAVTRAARAQAVAVIAAPAQLQADHLAFNHVQSEAIRADPDFHGGHYYHRGDGRGPVRGLALARQIAFLTYRSAHELDARFGRARQSAAHPVASPRLDEENRPFAIASYLTHQGDKLTQRFDANCYLSLVATMNSHDVSRGHGTVDAALRRATVPTLVIGIDSDRLFPVALQHEIAQALPASVSGTSAHVVRSAHGHDGFLLESRAITDALTGLLDATSGG